MKEHQVVYDKVIDNLMKKYYIAVGVLFLTEILVFFALWNAGEIKYSVLDYIINRLMFPTLINVFVVYIGTKLVKAPKLKEQTKNFVAVFISFALAEVVIIYHTYFTSVILIMFLPIVISKLFGDRKILRDITNWCLVGSIVHIYICMTEYIDAPVTYHVVNYIVIVIIIKVISYFIAMIIDVENEKTKIINEQYEKLKESSYSLTHDETTGIYNECAFRNQLEKSVKLAKADFNKKIYLIMIKFGDLEEITDNFGIEMKNKILSNFANQLKDTFEDVEGIARCGKNNFGVIIEDSLTREEIVEKVRNLKKNVTKTNNMLDEESLLFVAGILEYKVPMEVEDFYDNAKRTIEEASEKHESQILVVR